MIPISERLLAVSTQAEFAAAIDFEFQELGFRTYLAQTVPNRHLDAAREWSGCHAIPKAWLESSVGFHNASLGAVCPVMQHLKHNSTPLVWSADEYYRAGLHDLYEEQAACGLASGIAIAMHLPNGRHFLVGADDPRNLKMSRDLPEMVSRLQLISVYAQVAAERVFFATTPGSLPSLTPRERECLLWASVGKDTGDTAAILGIAEATVQNHRRAILQKLECTNITHAVAKGLRLGLI